MTRPERVAVGFRFALAAAIGVPWSAAAGQESLGAMEYRWRLSTVAGEAVHASAFSGEILVLNVWATWCRPCVREMPSLQALHDRFAPRGVRVVALAADRPGPVRRFLARHRLSLPTFLEVDPVPAGLGVSAVPTTLVIDRQGRIVLRHRGAADWDRPEVHAFLEALLAQPRSLERLERP